jgi:choline dehydrogenase-like flavoprotein
LAAGTLGSTALVLGSPACPTKTARFLDSQYFTIPLFLLDSTRHVRNEPLHTLAQLFLEILPGPISSRLIHLQVYTYSDMIRRLMERKLGLLPHGLGSFIERAEGRLAFLQGYLHSDDSGTMEMTWHPEGGGPGQISVSAHLNPRSRRVIRSVLAKLSRHAWQTGFLPIWPMLQVGSPGRGFHSGGSLPMRGSAQGKEVASDLWGRPFGLQRVHVVDSSIFPSIPATTITLTAMANAHRIAAEAGFMKP